MSVTNSEPMNVCYVQKEGSKLSVRNFIYFFTADPNTDPNVLAIDGRYTHTQQIQERLDFLR